MCRFNTLLFDNRSAKLQEVSDTVTPALLIGSWHANNGKNVCHAAQILALQEWNEAGQERQTEGAMTRGEIPNGAAKTGAVGDYFVCQSL